MAADPCPECGDQIVEFRGQRLDSEYRVCTQWNTRHGKTYAEVGKIIADFRAKASGGRTRFA